MHITWAYPQGTHSAGEESRSASKHIHWEGATSAPSGGPVDSGGPLQTRSPNTTENLTSSQILSPNELVPNF